MSFLWFCVSAVTALHLELNQGIINGDENAYAQVFTGVPYAKPPINELRWRPTVSIQNFGNLTQHVHQCIQADLEVTDNEIPQSEDCLTLNIYRPVDIKDEEVLPIMMYYHGGSHQVGTSHRKG